MFELVRRGAATGLRVDHVDGLFAPADYLRRLQARRRRRERESPAPRARPSRLRPALYIVVEKILGPGEQLPSEWPVHGTTGYEFAAAVNNLFVDRRNERAFERHLHADSSASAASGSSFAELAYRSKKLIMHETMSGDINSLGHQLNRFSERNRHFRDFTLYSLISTLKEIIACFPVYRTYVTADRPVATPIAASSPRRSRREAANAGGPALVFDFIERLLLQADAGPTAEECEERARFIGKFQQITSPVAAKGIEDTALYIYNRLLSLNEVGSDPTARSASIPPRSTHWMAGRRCRWPACAVGHVDARHASGARMSARGSTCCLRFPAAWKAAVTSGAR